MMRRLALMFGLAAASCGPQPPQTLQGYAEGDYIYAAAPQGGWLSQVSVKRGQTVQQGAPLFALDADQQLAQQTRATAQAAQARSALANLQKGRRIDELKAIEASLAQALASARLAEAEYRRMRDLAQRGFAARKLLDAARANHETAQARVREVDATLATAKLGARADEVEAAKAQVAAAEASLTEAAYALSQRQIKARVGGLIDDTLREAGEYVPAGGAVIRILPPGNIKIRFFAPEPLRAELKLGMSLSYGCTSCPAGLRAKITYIASDPEFTPPVIYSVGSREKLVWMMEAVPEGRDFMPSPGQPIDLIPPQAAGRDRVAHSLQSGSSQ